MSSWSSRCPIPDKYRLIRRLRSLPVPKDVIGYRGFGGISTRLSGPAEGSVFKPRAIEGEEISPYKLV